MRAFSSSRHARGWPLVTGHRRHGAIDGHHFAGAAVLLFDRHAHELLIDCIAFFASYHGISDAFPCRIERYPGIGAEDELLGVGVRVGLPVGPQGLYKLFVDWGHAAIVGAGPCAGAKLGAR